MCVFSSKRFWVCFTVLKKSICFFCALIRGLCVKTRDNILNFFGIPNTSNAKDFDSAFILSAIDDWYSNRDDFRDFVRGPLHDELVNLLPSPALPCAYVPVILSSLWALVFDVGLSLHKSGIDGQSLCNFFLSLLVVDLMVLGYIQWCILPQWQDCSVISWFLAHCLGTDVVRRWWNRLVQPCGLRLVASRNSNNQPLPDQLVRCLLAADSMLHFGCIQNLQKTRPTQFWLTNLKVLQIRSAKRKQSWKHHGVTRCGLKSFLIV